MAQEHVTNVSLGQGEMIKKFTDIAQWMQQYETLSFRIPPTDTTKPFSTKGYCSALSIYLLNDALYEKRKINPQYTWI